MDTTPQTELEAVNIILDNDGEAPVATLDEGGFSETSDAQRTLREISRRVQTKGWGFNVDRERKFIPNVDNEIILPGDTLWVEPNMKSLFLSVVERGRKLYNLDANNFTFTNPVYLDICQFLDFTDLPSYARDCITIKAAMVYQARGTGSVRQDGFTQRDLDDAMAVMKQADRRMKRIGKFRTPRGRRFQTRRPL